MQYEEIKYLIQMQIASTEFNGDLRATRTFRQNNFKILNYANVKSKVPSELVVRNHDVALSSNRSQSTWAYH